MTYSASYPGRSCFMKNNFFACSVRASRPISRYIFCAVLTQVGTKFRSGRSLFFVNFTGTTLEFYSATLLFSSGLRTIGYSLETIALRPQGYI